MIIYENTIKSKGSLVGEFGDGMFILFGDNAPDMLKDYCYGIDVVPTNATIEVGQTLLTYDLELVKEKAKDIITPCVVTNMDAIESISVLKLNENVDFSQEVANLKLK